MFGIGSSYYGSSARLKCSFKNVKSLEDLTKAKNTATQLTQRIVSIVFLNSSLSQLPEKMFVTFATVKTLDASNLVLNEISPSAFFGVSSWDSIVLTNNNIKTLKDRTFASMSIKNLDLSYNVLESIEDKVFTSAEIEKINLSFNKLTSIGFINSLNYFNEVQLQNNLLESLSKIEVKKDSWISRRGLFNDDPEYPKLFLQNNKLKSIDCRSTVRISSLNLEKNPSLTDVALNECFVDEIDVSDCKSLKKVTLNDNLLGFTAKNVKLDDVVMSEAKSLTTLSVANSSLSQTLFDKFMKMENLTFLDLSYNSIGPLNISTFSKLKALQFLYLKATNISNIQFGTFSHQHSVKLLDISENYLGYFDMNWIFSLTSLMSLDLSGNNFTSLDNIDSTGHFTFTLLQKIDLSNNNWPCDYLLRLIKIFRVYKVALTRSNVEEERKNIHGISCYRSEEKIPGDANSVEPLSADSSNITEVKAKMNELINEMNKNTQFKTSFESRMKSVETRVNNQATVSNAVSAGLHYDESRQMEVKNSALLETALVIVCVCFTIFMSMKIYVYVKRNFLSKPKPMRTESARQLSMAVDDY